MVMQKKLYRKWIDFVNCGGPFGRVCYQRGYPMYLLTTLRQFLSLYLNIMRLGVAISVLPIDVPALPFQSLLAIRYIDEPQIHLNPEMLASPCNT